MTTYILFVFILTLFRITATHVARNAVLTTRAYSCDTFRFAGASYRGFRGFHFKGQPLNRQF